VELPVRTVSVEDRKAVFAVVTSIDQTRARARIGGTLETLSVDEGTAVERGQVIGRVSDPKVRLQLVALDARIKATEARRKLADTQLERVEALRKRGTVSQAALDEATTNLDVVVAEIAALRAERAVIAQQDKEGDIVAPAKGRVLSVMATAGTVVQPGEVIADIATDTYILRLSIPERHARHIAVGQTIQIGSRGLAAESTALRQGLVRLVYPQITGGRVTADVEVKDLGDYFVGERTRVWISTGRRDTIVIPESYIINRFGLTFVRLKSGAEVVVQTGQTLSQGVEVLSGLHDGDVLVTP
jgi:RND family efflux transporter MFP subunit